MGSARRRPTPGNPNKAEWRHGNGRVETVAIGQLADGPVVVSGGEDGKLRRWRMADGSPCGKPLDLGKGKVTSAAIGDLDHRPFIAAAYEAVCTVGLWDLATGALLGELEWGSEFPLHKRFHADVNAVAAGALPDGTPIIVTGHSDGAHKWVRTGGKWAAERLISGDDAIWAVALGVLGGRQVAVCGGSLGFGGALITLDLESGKQAIPSYESPDGMVIGAAVGEVDGDAVAVSGNFFGTDPGIMRVWDLTNEEKPVRGSLVGHYGGSKALAITLLDGRPVLVSGGFDRTVRAWDLKDSLDRMPDRVEHQTIKWLQACELSGRPVVVSKSSARVSFSKSWVWHKKVNKSYRPTDGPFFISRAAVVEREDTDTSAKPVIRVWDQADGTPADARPLDVDRLRDVCATGGVGDWALGVSVDDPTRSGPRASGPGMRASPAPEGSRPAGVPRSPAELRRASLRERFPREKNTHLRVRDLRTGAQVGRPIPINHGAELTIAIGGLGDRPVVVFGDDFPGNDDFPGDDDLLEDVRLQAWDVRSGTLVWEPLPAYHSRGPHIRAFGTPAGLPIAAVTALNRFGIWDLQRGELIAEPPSMQGEMWLFPPVAIGELVGRPVVVYSGYGRPIRVWDLMADHECERAIEVDTEIQAITIAPDSTIIAAWPGGACALRVEDTFFDPVPATRGRRTKAVGTEVRVFTVAGPADRAYLASISPQDPVERDQEHEELKRKLSLIDKDELHSGYDNFGRLVLYGARAVGSFDWSTLTTRYDGTTETVFAVGWPFLRMEYRPLWSGCDEDLDDAAVFRSEVGSGGAVYIFLPDGRIDLLLAEDDLSWTFSWGYGGSGPGRLEISICRAAGLLRGEHQATYPAFRRWLEHLVETEQHRDRPLEIPVGLVRAKFQQLKETSGE